MRVLHRYMPVTLPSLAIGSLLIQLVFIVQLAQAHLMVAQQGTLNIVDDGAFMVLSLPVSAFDDVDDDDDGQVSMVEFNRHRGAITDAVEEKVTLSDFRGNFALRGIMLSPVVPHGTAAESLTQITVMGRFSLDDADSELRFHVGLYGSGYAEKSLEIMATRDGGTEQAVFELSPDAPARVIFAGLNPAR